MNQNKPKMLLFHYASLAIWHKFDYFRTLLSFGIEWTKDSDPELSKNLSNELKEAWLKSAKVARKAGHFQQGEPAFCGAGK